MDMRSFDHKGFRVAMQGNSSWHEKVIIRYFFNELSSHKNVEVLVVGPIRHRTQEGI